MSDSPDPDYCAHGTDRGGTCDQCRQQGDKAPAVVSAGSQPAPTKTLDIGAMMTDEKIARLIGNLRHYGGRSTIHPHSGAWILDAAEALALLSANKSPAIDVAVDHSDAASDLAFSVYSGLNALRWLLNITTEFDRKDVRTRQAARLLDEYTDSFGKTNRERLENMWKTLNERLPDDGRISEYLRAQDAAGRALKATGSSQ